MDPLSGVGLQVRALRRRQGLTQEDLALQIDRSVETLSALERGKTLPTLGVLQRIAAVLRVPLRDFFPLPGAAAETRAQAALFSELMSNARSLPLAELEMTVRLVEVVADCHGAGALDGSGLDGGDVKGNGVNGNGPPSNGEA